MGLLKLIISNNSVTLSADTDKFNQARYLKKNNVRQIIIIIIFLTEKTVERS